MAASASQSVAGHWTYTGSGGVKLGGTYWIYGDVITLEGLTFTIPTLDSPSLTIPLLGSVGFTIAELDDEELIA